MRRGHAGIGGWRNENTRQFRPRTGGPPHFRHPSRNYPTLETPRFPPPGPRLLRGPPPYNNHPDQVKNRHTPDHHERNKYRHDSHQTNQFRPPDRSHHQNQRSIYPMLDRLRQKDASDHSQYKDYYDNSHREPNQVNSMGDIDHRQQGLNTLDPYSRHPIPPWTNPPEMQRRFYDDRNKYNKQYKHHDSIESNKIPLLDYTGHRPPASDHYGGNPSSSLDSSHSFSRSVDDTVDIVRRRLQNRNEIQPPGTVDHHDEDLRIPPSITDSYQNITPEQPPKRRIQRQKQDRSAESNCDKMKSKIVQQLFKMDKDRIHKLMDNPSSSTKFEYAISSLITESQNSLNKHLRSVAEKSLSSSEEFVHNDNNTIYEDTFMKQMQNILDPQDTILLEDIKPLVLAELSKVLQLNEYEQPFQVVDDQQSYQEHYAQEQHNYDSYRGEPHNYENYSDSQNSYYDQITTPPVGYEDYGNADMSHTEYDQPEPEKPKPLFERRGNRSVDYRPDPTFSPVEDPQMTTNSIVNSSREELPLFPSNRRPSRRSVESKQSEEKNKEPEPPIPLFDSNTSQFSEDDDPFAELDNQYHVAVDPNFINIDAYGEPSPQPSSRNNSRSSSKSREFSNKAKTPIKEPASIKQEIDSQLHDIAMSPIKLPSHNSSNKNIKEEPKINYIEPKKEVITPTKDNTNLENKLSISVKQDCNTDSRNVNNHSESSQYTSKSAKAVSSTSSRKRSIDQKPAHRKEKRKKSEPSQTDSNQQILNKNIIINVNDCAKKDKEKCTETAKSVFNLFFSKNENSKEVPKDAKKVQSVDKKYSDKYVKRKEPQKKSNEKEDAQKKRQRSVSTSHSIVSPKDGTNNNTQSSKTDSKTKLQSFDMFTEQPKKTTTKHQAHRNTALSPNTPTKTAEIIKSKQPLITYNKKITKNHVAIQAKVDANVKETQTEPQTSPEKSKSCNSQSCKANKKKMLEKNIQTDPVTIKNAPNKATDAFERMKEIDMEIQVLLQEKFKLYSSLESNTSCPSTIQTLGMTVLNVPLNEVTENNENSENLLSEDAIVDDFTNIPVEELEQIALETVDTPVAEKRTRRHKLSEQSRASSSSPTVKKGNRKPGKLNISLLEQILIDDRPLEDIISLDDLEKTPVKTKKKPVKQYKKKGNKKITHNVIKTPNAVTMYDLKECCVVLQREDFSKFLKPKVDEETGQNKEIEVTIKIDSNPGSPTNETEVTEKPEEITEKLEVQVFNDSDVVEETVVENDLQFDMLDVSEDIVIGDICEVKCGDKEEERIESIITEDIILDNSQSALEPVHLEASAENICKMYDYSTDETLRRDAITVSGHADAVLAIECVENNFVAACLDGNVYYFSNDGQLLSTLRGSNLAVTCLTIVKEKYGTTVYTGSLDSRIRYFDLETGLEKGPECNVLSPIQTMDRAWDTIFVGTRTGFVLQFECKNNMLIPVSTVKFSDQAILALRAMKEGPRKVLLVACRSEDVTIKDAQTGLLLRSLQGPKMTVYTLLYEDGKVYCGTSSHLVHVFDYTSGAHVGAHESGKGAVCLRAAGGLLFAGCYDGCVYVYREGEPRALAQLRGPGLMLLSLAVVGSKIIAGYKDRSLYIWKIPLSILQEMIL